MANKNKKPHTSGPYIPGLPRKHKYYACTRCAEGPCYLILSTPRAQRPEFIPQCPVDPNNLFLRADPMAQDPNPNQSYYMDPIDPELFVALVTPAGAITRDPPTPIKTRKDQTNG